MISDGLLNAAAASLAVDIQHAIPIRTRCQSAIRRDTNPVMAGLDPAISIEMFAD